MSDPNEIKVNTVAFNHDGSLFALGTTKGFSIFSCSPFKVLCSENIEGGVSLVQVLGKSNIICYVKTITNKKETISEIVLWDQSKHAVILDVKLPEKVLAIKINFLHLFIISKNKIEVFLVSKMASIEEIKTQDNPRGIFSVTQTEQGSIMVYPYSKKSKVGVVNFYINEQQNENNKNTNEDKEFNFWAHTSAIGCLAINREGTLITTCSENGTLIRVFNLKGEIGYEFRRGSDKAVIMNLSFDYNSNFVACTSDKGTIHVFVLSQTGTVDFDLNNPEQTKNRHEFHEIDTHESFFGNLMNKISAAKRLAEVHRSYAQFRLESKNSYCSFYGEGNDLFLHVISPEGIFYKAEFDPKAGGEIIDYMPYDLTSKVEEFNQVKTSS